VDPERSARRLSENFTQSAAAQAQARTPQKLFPQNTHRLCGYVDNKIAQTLKESMIAP